jgi:hypothetical protein
MLTLIVFVLALAAAIVVPARLPDRVGAVGRVAVRLVLIAVAIIAAADTSFVRVPADSVGLVRKLYGAHAMPEGHVVAAAGETGWQAGVLPPGAFHVSPFLRVVNEITFVPVVNVPQGFYGRIVTRDGTPLDEGQVMADAWPDAEFAHFLDATYFLTHGGRRGLQASILKPGTYPLNLALYSVRIGHEPNGRDVTDNVDEVYDLNGYRTESSPLSTAITRVPAGFVGVVRSTIAEPGLACQDITDNTEGGGLVARLVPRGCKGIWVDALAPGDYYLNRDAFDVTLVDTRVQTLEFKGGYTRRYIDLKVDQRGDFTQAERSVVVPFEAARSVDAAVGTKVEGWEVPQELRAVLQIQPRHAATVVAAVGSLAEVETRIMVPAIRSHVRNVFGGTVDVTEPDATGHPVTVTRPTRVLDLIEQRPALEAAILARVQEDGRRAGVDVKEIRLGESAIPPELLLARQREQLAEQLKRAYEQERIAQTERQAAEEARATADQQADLVHSQIAVQKAQLSEQQRRAEGRAERAYLEEQAAGQTAQVGVLGRDSVLLLQQTKIWAELLAAHPELLANLRLPQTMVFGGGLEGAAATFGSALARPAEPPK